MLVHLQPLGPVDGNVLDFLRRRLSMLWEVVVNPPLELPQEAYDPARRQFEGSRLLQGLPEEKDAVLAVTDADAYVPGLNYIFGLAWKNRALISLKRLRPEFYGAAENEELFLFRALKESMHELGHVLGLNHCPDRGCVMYFSNSILDTDFKDWRYCGPCDWEAMRAQSGH